MHARKCKLIFIDFVYYMCKQKSVYYLLLNGERHIHRHTSIKYIHGTSTLNMYNTYHRHIIKVLLKSYPIARSPFNRTLYIGTFTPNSHTPHKKKKKLHFIYCFVTQSAKIFGYLPNAIFTWRVCRYTIPI